MNVYGYSERGVQNSLLYEILYSNEADALLEQLIAKAAFPLTVEKPRSGAATVLSRTVSFGFRYRRCDYPHIVSKCRELRDFC